MLINLFISLILNLIVNFFVFRNNYYSWLAILWLISILILIFSALKTGKLNVVRIFRADKQFFFILFIILLPLILRIINLNPNRIHQDEFETAYFSSQYNLTTTNFFSGIPESDVWVAQFPSPFFVLQKIFFLLFGENPLSIKLSVLPYVFLVSLMLFLLCEKIFNRQIAIISVILYAFLSVSVYFETLGLHFISSTAVFLIFFYFLIRYFRKNNVQLSLLSGISCGFNYLFYLSSYLALPLGIFVYIILFLKQRKAYLIKHLLLFLISFLLVTSPFLTYISTQKNYLPVRFEAVSFIAKLLTKNKEERISKEVAFHEANLNLRDSFMSLSQDGIGGHGGYDFGNLAMFERFSLVIFLTGFIIAIFLAFKKIEIFYIQIVILISFLLGMVLTTPPPAYHRFSLAFPFIAIISSLPIYLFLSAKIIYKNLRYLLFLIFMFIYIYTNQAYFSKAVTQDVKRNNFDLAQVKIINYIKHNYPGRKIYIAAFPIFALKYIYYFFDKTADIKADYHEDLIDNFNPKEKYVYILTYPEDFKQKFAALDKNGKFIKKFTDEYVLFVN